MDVTREELPDTMAAVRLSGMEISDLTMELSDLGQAMVNLAFVGLTVLDLCSAYAEEITQDVRSSM